MAQYDLVHEGDGEDVASATRTGRSDKHGPCIRTARRCCRGRPQKYPQQCPRPSSGRRQSVGVASRPRSVSISQGWRSRGARPARRRNRTVRSCVGGDGGIGQPNGLAYSRFFAPITHSRRREGAPDVLARLPSHLRCKCVHTSIGLIGDGPGVHPNARRAIRLKAASGGEPSPEQSFRSGGMLSPFGGRERSGWE
jgi:hypothetical protein